MPPKARRSVPGRMSEAETAGRRPGAVIGPEKVQCIIELVHTKPGAVLTDGASSTDRP